MHPSRGGTTAIALLFLAATGHLASANSVDCQQRDGIFPFSPCSDKLVYCHNGYKSLQSCPAGLVFNSDASQCDFRSNVAGCSGGSYGEVTVSPTSTTGSPLPESSSLAVQMKTTVQPSTTITVTTSSAVCVEGQRLPIGLCNSVFNECSNGQIVSKQCPSGSLFDTKYGVCLFGPPACSSTATPSADTATYAAYNPVSPTVSVPIGPVRKGICQQGRDYPRGDCMSTFWRCRDGESFDQVECPSSYRFDPVLLTCRLGSDVKSCTGESEDVPLYVNNAADGDNWRLSHADNYDNEAINYHYVPHRKQYDSDHFDSSEFDENDYGYVSDSFRGNAEQFPNDIISNPFYNSHRFGGVDIKGLHGHRHRHGSRSSKKVVRTSDGFEGRNVIERVPNPFYDGKQREAFVTDVLDKDSGRLTDSVYKFFPEHNPKDDYYSSEEYEAPHAYKRPRYGHGKREESEEDDEETMTPATELPSTGLPLIEVIERTTEQPSTDLPSSKTSTEQPSEAISSENPSTELPSTEQPSTEASTDQPSTEASTEQSSAAPASEIPVTEQASSEIPSSEEPSTELPSTEQPSTEPSSETPTTEQASSELPSSVEPSTELPSSEAPTTEQPTTEVPATGLPLLRNENTGPVAFDVEIEDPEGSGEDDETDAARKKRYITASNHVCSSGNIEAIALGFCKENFVLCTEDRQALMAACPVGEMFDGVQKVCVVESLCSGIPETLPNNEGSIATAAVPSYLVDDRVIPYSPQIGQSTAAPSWNQATSALPQAPIYDTRLPVYESPRPNGGYETPVKTPEYTTQAPVTAAQPRIPLYPVNAPENNVYSVPQQPQTPSGSQYTGPVVQKWQAPQIYAQGAEEEAFVTYPEGTDRSVYSKYDVFAANNRDEIGVMVDPVVQNQHYMYNDVFAQTNLPKEVAPPAYTQVQNVQRVPFQNDQTIIPLITEENRPKHVQLPIAPTVEEKMPQPVSQAPQVVLPQQATQDLFGETAKEPAFEPLSQPEENLSYKPELIRPTTVPTLETVTTRIIPTVPFRLPETNAGHVSTDAVPERAVPPQTVNSQPDVLPYRPALVRVDSSVLRPIAPADFPKTVPNEETPRSTISQHIPLATVDQSTASGPSKILQPSTDANVVPYRPSLMKDVSSTLAGSQAAVSQTTVSENNKDVPALTSVSSQLTSSDPSLPLEQSMDGSVLPYRPSLSRAEPMSPSVDHEAVEPYRPQSTQKTQLPPTFTSPPSETSQRPDVESYRPHIEQNAQVGSKTEENLRPVSLTEQPTGAPSSSDEGVMQTELSTFSPAVLRSSTSAPVHQMEILPGTPVTIPPEVVILCNSEDGAVGDECADFYFFCASGVARQINCPVGSGFSVRSASCEILAHIAACSNVPAHMKPIEISLDSPRSAEPEAKATGDSTNLLPSDALLVDETPFVPSGAIELSSNESIDVTTMASLVSGGFACEFKARTPRYPLSACGLTFAVCEDSGFAHAANCSLGELFDHVRYECVPAEHCGRAQHYETNARMETPDFESPEVECANVKRGSSRSVGSCSAYFVKCTDHAYVSRCPKNMIFVEAKQKCVARKNVPACLAQNIGDSKAPVAQSSPLLSINTPKEVLSDAFCTIRSDGIYRHPEKCDGVIKCHDGLTLQLAPCTSGLVFNNATKFCDYPNNVPGCEPAASAVIMNRNSTELGCNGHAHGDHVPDEENCGMYWRCVWNRLVRMPCPDSTVFNDDLSTCDWPSNVPACVRGPGTPRSAPSTGADAPLDDESAEDTAEFD